MTRVGRRMNETHYGVAGGEAGNEKKNNCGSLKGETFVVCCPTIRGKGAPISGAGGGWIGRNELRIPRNTTKINKFFFLVWGGSGGGRFFATHRHREEIERNRRAESVRETDGSKK
jgi:hypothetical protein